MTAAPQMASPHGDLAAPLLDGSSPEVLIDVGDAGPLPAANGVLDHRRSRSGPSSRENPFEFLGASALQLPPASPIDPFRNHTPDCGGLYEWCKVVVCLPIVAIRLALFSLALAVGYLATLLALYRWKDKQRPLPRWRCGVMWITRFCARCILFAFGYHWIRRKGRPAPREIAPIVVCNHVSYIDPIYFFYELSPTIVASESHDALPFVGTIIRAMQVIYVDRFSAQSRKQAVHEIKRKASSIGFPRVMLFPEGTTTNGRFLLSFRLGAFIPGFPVQPVVVRYPYVHFDQSWGNISLLKLMFRMFTQFHNFMEVEYLPVVFPPESKQQNAVHFAQRTSYAMASALNVLQTSHSYGDMILVSRASDIVKHNLSNYMVEMALVESSFDISPSDAMVFLDRFLAMKPDSTGRVHFHDFLAVFGLGSNHLTKKIFGYLDLEMQESITFRQFLTGSAHIKNQSLFPRACEIAFTRCSGTMTGHVLLQQIGDIVLSIVPGTHVETFKKLFNAGSDGLIGQEDFVECLKKNPLLIALFAAYVKFDDLDIIRIEL